MNFSFLRTATVLLPCVLFLTTSAFADTVLTNLNKTALAGDQGEYVGQAFTTGATSMDLTSATIEIKSALRGTPELELEAANANGTVSSTLFTFTYASDSYQNPYSSLLTFNAANYVLAPDTTYFLVLSDAGAVVTWNYAGSTSYTAQDGFVLPTKDTSFVSSADNTEKNGYYYPLSDDPAIFSLSASPIAATPEPSSLVLLGTGLFGVFGAARKKLLKA